MSFYKIVTAAHHIKIAKLSVYLEENKDLTVDALAPTSSELLSVAQDQANIEKIYRYHGSCF